MIGEDFQDLKNSEILKLFIGELEYEALARK
jgi:hypothetical protein